MDPVLAEAFLNRKKHTVLGVPLRRLSLWHAFLFEALEIPGLGPLPQNITELGAAVNVVRQFPLLWQALTIKNLEAFSFATELESWHAYIADYHALPEFLSPEEGKPVRSHWTLFRAAQLMRYAGYTEQAAWDCPIGRACWTCAALAEANGADPGLIDDRVRELLNQAGQEP